MGGGVTWIYVNMCVIEARTHNIMLLKSLNCIAVWPFLRVENVFYQQDSDKYLINFANIPC